MFLSKSVFALQNPLMKQRILISEKRGFLLHHFFRKKTSCNIHRKWSEHMMKKGSEILLKDVQQPYRTLFIIMVGRTRCPAAVESCKELIVWLSKMLGQQWRVHTSQRIHRALQLYSCYSRMFGEEMTRKMLTKIRRFLVSSSRGLLLSAVCVTPYDWDQRKISDDRLDRCSEEFESLDSLLSSTVCCEDCSKRQMVNTNNSDVDYCTCGGNVAYADRSRQFEGWEAFLERENILVWRKKQQDSSNLYSYKVYGSYEDLSLSAFLEVQLNPYYRKEWDASVLELKVVDSEPDTHSDLLYWLVKFPHFFSNRDYVFERRFRIDDRSKEVVIVNEVACHPGLPEVPGVHRVRQYWSVMVLRAEEDFSKPGMSYTLTYFDNPGTSLPAPVTNFVASTAFPDFLVKVHGAALSLQHRWDRGEDVYVSLPRYLRLPKATESDGSGKRESEGPPSIPEETTESPTTDIEIGQNELEQKVVKYRPALIELMEAIEVLSPVLEEKTKLTYKIEAVVEKLGLEQKRKDVLVKRLEVIRDRTKNFIAEAEKKKEESMKIMNEFERKRGYYDNSSVDPSLLLFTGVLNAINEILLEDKDMRTGKLFRKGDNSKNNEFKDTVDDTQGNEDTEVINDSNLTLTNSSDTLQPNCTKETIEIHDKSHCKCCSCDYLEEKSSWYEFSYWKSWMTSKTTELDEFCRSCVCEHKEKPQSTEKIQSDNVNLKEHNELSNDTSLYSFYSWFSYFWVFNSPKSSSDSTSEISVSQNNSSNSENTLNSSPNFAQNTSNSTTTNDKRSNSATLSYIPWYMKLWHFVF